MIEITIPVLNEEEELEASLQTLGAFLAAQGYQDMRIVLADNGSTDKTPEIAQGLCARYPWLSYVRVEGRGVGRALKKSWGESQADIIGYMDLDLATDLKHIPEMLAAFAQGADIVYGSRLHRKSVVRGRKLSRSILSRGFNFILKTYLGVKISDGMCGFKFLRRPLYPMLAAGGAVSDGWFFCAELLVVGEWKGLRMVELPVVWTDSPSSKVRVVSLSLAYLKAMRVLRQRR